MTPCDDDGSGAPAACWNRSGRDPAGLGGFIRGVGVIRIDVA
jgi:hypothetical protein